MLDVYILEAPYICTFTNTPLNYACTELQAYAAQLKLAYILGIVGDVAEQDQGRGCDMGRYVEVAAPTAMLCK